jgi:hypothetical protein
MTCSFLMAILISRCSSRSEGRYMNNFHFNLTDSQGRAQTTGPSELMEDLRGRENIIPVS